MNSHESWCNSLYPHLDLACNCRSPRYVKQAPSDIIELYITRDALAPPALLTPYPAPFPGDDTEQLTCTKCGATYTMGEYRCFAWVAHSDLCVSCGAEALYDKIAKMLRGEET